MSELIPRAETKDECIDRLEKELGNKVSVLEAHRRQMSGHRTAALVFVILSFVLGLATGLLL